jgi:hypothetical protein
VYTVAAGGTGSGNVAGGLAGGTSHWKGGLTWVGERGPELVNLPRGSRVYTASESKRMAQGRTASVGVGGGGGVTVVNVHVEGSLIHERDLENRIKRAVVQGGKRTGSFAGGYA